jgi:hypothetical protein
MATAEPHRLSQYGTPYSVSFSYLPYSCAYDASSSNCKSSMGAKSASMTATQALELAQLAQNFKCDLPSGELFISYSPLGRCPWCSRHSRVAKLGQGTGIFGGKTGEPYGSDERGKLHL